MITALLATIVGQTSAEIKPGTPIETIVAQAANVTPSSQQLEWQRNEFTLFVHFGQNTFSGREWGTGLEKPSDFNPSALSTDQWAEAAKAAGAKMIILVAKHHDGFCLWPSAYTEHNVKNSPYKNGKGDIVKECAASCKKYGLKFGVYLSPADLNAPSYGDTPGYNNYYMNQMREILSKYDIREMWWDGANPKGKDMVYWRNQWIDLVRELAPKAAIFGCGPDCRWVGNESGYARETEWSVIPLQTSPRDEAWKDKTGPDLGSREKLKDAKWLHWYPAETDVSIRPGWFWHESENDKVKSLETLANIYFESVGRNSVLLLNVPPDKRGLFHETDVERLKQFGQFIKNTFSTNFAKGAKVTDTTREATPADMRGGGAFGVLAPKAGGAKNVVDGKPDSFWQSKAGTTFGSLEIELKGAQSFDVIMLQENIQVGQRVEKFAVDVWQGSDWKEIAKGTTIGYKRLLKVPMTTASKVRVRLLESRLNPTLTEVGLYKMAPVK